MHCHQRKPFTNPLKSRCSHASRGQGSWPVHVGSDFDWPIGERAVGDSRGQCLILGGKIRTRLAFRHSPTASLVSKSFFQKAPAEIMELEGLPRDNPGFVSASWLGL